MRELLQRRLLYFPIRASVDQMAAAGLSAWPVSDDFRGLVAEPVGPARATLILFHGNGGHAGHRVGYAASLAPLGVRVILAEYPGYGPRDGRPAEASLVADAVETIDRAQRAWGPPLLIAGESLGAAVAAAAAARRRETVAGLLLLTPWDRLASVATQHYPLLPVKWLLRDRFDSASALAEFGQPVLVAVADRDAVVPAHAGLALFESLSQPKRLVRMAAGHNDWMGVADAAWWHRAVDFLLQTPS